MMMLIMMLYRMLQLRLLRKCINRLAMIAVLGISTLYADAQKAPAPPSSSAALINITLYPNGTAAALKKIKADLKTGYQNLIYDKIPKTLDPTSLIVTLDAEDAHMQLLGQFISDDMQKLNLEVLSSYDQVKILNIYYVFSGITWDVYYTGILSSDQKTLTLSGWIEVTNKSGSTIDQAQIYLDGSATKITPDALTVMDHSKSHFRYLIPRVITLPEDKKIYISFINAIHIPLEEENIINLGGAYLDDLKGEIQHPNIQRVIQFSNDEKNGLNMTLPAGKITLFQGHENGLTEFIGQAMIQETPLGGKVPIDIGHDFYQGSVVCELEQTDYKKNSVKSSEAGYRLVIHNKGKAPLSIRAVLPLPKCHWTMVRNSLPFDVNGEAVSFDIPNVAASETPFELKYRIKVDGQ